MKLSDAKMKKFSMIFQRGLFSVRQKLILLLAFLYFSLLASLSIFSAEIMGNNLTGVSPYYARSGYVNDQFYNTVLARNCVFADDKGSHVWLLIEKDTPLGKRFYVKQQEV